MDEAEIGRLIDEYGKAISNGDIKAVARCWEVPAFVISEQGAVAISTRDEIESFYARAGQVYRAQGLVTSLPNIERIEQLSERLASADVTWSVSDAGGNEKMTERYQYILRQGSQGQARIQVIIAKA